MMLPFFVVLLPTTPTHNYLPVSVFFFPFVMEKATVAHDPREDNNH